MGAFVYMLRCADGSFYVGSATGEDLTMRIAQHQAGTFEGYTSLLRRVEIYATFFPHSRCDARSAPSRMVFNFGHTMLAATHSRPAKVPKPQSVEAMTRSRSPTAATACAMRPATTSGCSTKLLVDSITPGIRIMSFGNGCCRNAAY